jgi:hypothetical protein
MVNTFDKKFSMATAKTKKTSKRKPKFVATEELRTLICEDYFVTKLPATEIAEKYNVGKVTLYKILKEKRNAFGSVPPFDPSPIIAREDLDLLAREMALKSDSVSVTECTLALMKHHLKTEMDRIKDNPDAFPRIAIKDLTNFFKSAAPFVLNKMETKKKEEDSVADSLPFGSMFKKPNQPQA